MTVKRLIAATLAASFIGGMLPTRALAADAAAASPEKVASAPAPAPAATVDLRAAVRREAARLAAEHPNAAATALPVRHEEGAMAPAQGGGGGGMMAMMLVSLVASIGIAYYVIKQNKKNTDQNNGGQ
jgi:hypothetical protein